MRFPSPTSLIHKVFRNGLFPEAKNRNVFLYYIIEIALNMWFIEAVWYFYWGRFGSYSLIGLIFSITSLLQFFVVIPTGVLADMFGQKKSVVVGVGMLFAGSLIIALGVSIWQLFFGVVVQSLGRAFITGALDALVFESLKKEGKSEEYNHVVSFNTQMTILVFAVTAAMGGWLYSIHFRLAHIMSAIAALVAFVTSFFLAEVNAKKVYVDHLKSFINQHKEGFTELWLPQMRTFIIPALVLAVLMRMYDWGISKPTIAVGFGLFAKEQSVFYGVSAIVCALIVGQLVWFQKRLSDFNGAIILGALVSVGFILSFFPFGWWGVLVMLLIEIPGRLSYAWIPAIVNKRISSTYRATTLSTLEFIGRIPYIALNYLAGIAIDKKYIGQFHASFGVIGLIFLFMWFVTAKKKNSSV
ncbi:MAG: MFS transporter [Candidatus Roizmanbacteria bacterium]|nr:MFS transporter [Candidatus Roizmanbacteria bacterium]